MTTFNDFAGSTVDPMGFEGNGYFTAPPSEYMNTVPRHTSMINSPLTLAAESQPPVRQNHFGEFNATPEFGQTFGGGADNGLPSEFQSINNLIRNQEQSTVSPYSSMIQDVMSQNWDGWGNKQQKYSDRFAGYFDTAAKNLGQEFTSISPFQISKGSAPVFEATTADGKSYIIEVPHSPGGKFYDYQTQGWQSLGLGDLGGEGNEKIPKQSGASMIAKDQFTGLPSQTYLKNVNPSGEFNFASLLPLALAFIPGMQGAAVGLGDAILGGSSFLSPVVGNAAIGGLTSAVTGGDPLKGALAGGVGGFMGGSNFAGDMGISDPLLQKAVNSTLTSGAKQLINTGDINPEGLLMNGAIGYGSNLAGNTLGEQFGLSPEATKGLTGGLNAFGRQLVYNSPTAPKAPVSNNPYASLYQQYLQSKGG